MTPQRVTLITLGVADLARARAFYEAMGWRAAEAQESVAFYQMNGLVLALFGLADLAADQGRPGAALGTGAVTLAQNFTTEAEVDAAYAAALAAGATGLKAPEKVFWGGYSGYWADPDGHVWEVAMNPFWPLSDDGSLTLPGGAMTLTIQQLGLYAGALALLWLTPGPVWVAISARALSGGFRAAWPLALGVAIGDLLWPLVAILGLSVFVAEQEQVLQILRWVAMAIFIVMGIGLIRAAERPLSTDGRLTRPGLWAGFSAGVAAILGNPKAILFYMGVLPGFFDLARVTAVDIALICLISTAIPLAGNLGMGAVIARARAVLATPRGLATMNRVAGGLLIAVGLLLPFV